MPAVFAVKLITFTWPLSISQELGVAPGTVTFESVQGTDCQLQLFAKCQFVLLAPVHVVRSVVVILNVLLFALPGEAKAALLVSTRLMILPFTNALSE